MMCVFPQRVREKGAKIKEKVCRLETGGFIRHLTKHQPICFCFCCCGNSTESSTPDPVGKCVHVETSSDQMVVVIKDDENRSSSFNIVIAMVNHSVDSPLYHEEEKGFFFFYPQQEQPRSWKILSFHINIGAHNQWEREAQKNKFVVSQSHTSIERITSREVAI